MLVSFDAPFCADSFEGDDGVKFLTLSSFPMNESLKQLCGVVTDGDASVPPVIKSSFSLGKGTPLGDNMRLPVFLQYSRKFVCSALLKTASQGKSIDVLIDRSGPRSSYLFDL